MILSSPLRQSLDSGIAQFLSRPDLFKQIHLHTDVRLALGWSGVFVAGATAFYSWRQDFEKSKPVMWIGLIVCVLFTQRVALFAHYHSSWTQVRYPHAHTNALCVLHRG